MPLNYYSKQAVFTIWADADMISVAGEMSALIHLSKHKHSRCLFLYSKLNECPFKY